ncbi:ATP-dependent 6-phosphofructokinase [Actinidia chinensis var. chinensis]|uniref:ATP-dependent 6-phosphofructokinase n=1 Tax=Actinidia chinensis var. chinensis TaxID=1590841 RepID=A0A2R6QZK3_ACTCC|nr:ATP-dependent 6-phosphofructokinase [Actinidia chinensis var. chinensis]
MATATSSRDARRRRIMDRGSDRLALITGRIQTLPSSSSPPESLHSHTDTCPPSISHHHDLGSHEGEDKSSSSLLLQHESAGESGEINADDGQSREQPFLHISETSTEALRAPPFEVYDGLQSPQAVSTVQDPPICPPDTQDQLEPQVHRRKFFTPNQISSAIAATECTRVYCTLAAAILVVLSYGGFPILGSGITRSLIFFKPLYLVLLTNVSIVLARLLLKEQKWVDRVEQEANNVSSAGGYDLAEQAGKALELCLALQNIMGAAFMDCSVYVIALICGLSLAQKLR